MNQFDRIVLALLALPNDLKWVFLEEYWKEYHGKPFSEALKEILQND